MIYRSLFFGRRFYFLLMITISLFVISFGVSIIYPVARVTFVVLMILTLLDFALLFLRGEGIHVQRSLPDRFSNGERNRVSISLLNNFPFRISTITLDELPVQFQIRNFRISEILLPKERKNLEYHLRPVERGEYEFHNVNVFVKSPLKLIVRRYVVKSASKVKVFPSFQHLRKFELLAHASNVSESGTKRLRKIGRSLEFEQIKDYIFGDDIRNINWKATARRAQLMVNTFIDEKSQSVYCVLDQSRLMKMPFNGMSLLNYAINATLVLSDVILTKRDRAGLISFSDRISNFLPADKKANQMSSILEILYNLQTTFPEGDFERLHAFVKLRVSQRSLIVLFTNFESMGGLQRQLPFLKSIAKSHMLLVVFFENTGLKEISEKECADVEDVYMKTIAQKFQYEKRLIVKELRKHGIATLLTEPQNLTIESVNKYLELKARQAI